MRILFCNIAWMTYYQGVTEQDKPYHGGSWIDDHGEGAECLNYDLAPDGYFYGYVSTKSNRDRDNQLHIEKLNGVPADAEVADNVLVIWVAHEVSQPGNNVVVGWYRNAAVLRHYDYDDDWPFNVYAKAEDCILLPINKRHRVVPRAARKGFKYGMGQANVWFAQEPEAKEYVRLLVEYIMSYTDDNLADVRTVT